MDFCVTKSILQKKKICIFAIIVFMVLAFSGCGDTLESVWEPPVEGLSWGMSSKEVESLYPFSDVYTYTGDEGYFWVELAEKVSVYGIDMDVTLSFYEGEDMMLGLQSMSLKCPEDYSEQFLKYLEDRFDNAAVCTTNKNGISWCTKEVVSDYYSEEQLQAAFNEYLGEETISKTPELYDSFISAMSRSYFALYRFISNGESKGFTEISGAKLAIIKHLFTEDFRLDE